MSEKDQKNHTEKFQVRDVDYILKDVLIRKSGEHAGSDYLHRGDFNLPPELVSFDYKPRGDFNLPPELKRESEVNESLEDTAAEAPAKSGKSLWGALSGKVLGSFNAYHAFVESLFRKKSEKALETQKPYMDADQETPADGIDVSLFVDQETPAADSASDSAVGAADSAYEFESCSGSEESDVPEEELIDVFGADSSTSEEPDSEGIEFVIDSVDDQEPAVSLEEAAVAGEPVSLEEAAVAGEPMYVGVTFDGQYAPILMLAAGESVFVNAANKGLWKKTLENLDLAYVNAEEDKKQDAGEFRNYIFAIYAGAKGAESKDTGILVYVLSELANAESEKGNKAKALDYAKRASQAAEAQLLENPSAEALHKWGMLEHNVEFYTNKQETVEAE